MSHEARYGHTCPRCHLWALRTHEPQDCIDALLQQREFTAERVHHTSRLEAEVRRLREGVRHHIAARHDFLGELTQLLADADTL